MLQKKKSKLCMCVCARAHTHTHTQIFVSHSNYHFSSAPSTLRSGIFGIFLFKYADDILSSA